MTRCSLRSQENKGEPQWGRNGEGMAGYKLSEGVNGKDLMMTLMGRSIQKEEEEGKIMLRMSENPYRTVLLFT